MSHLLTTALDAATLPLDPVNAQVALFAIAPQFVAVGHQRQLVLASGCSQHAVDRVAVKFAGQAIGGNCNFMDRSSSPRLLAVSISS